MPNVVSFSNCHDAIAALAAVHLVGVCPPTAAVYTPTSAWAGVVGTHARRHAPPTDRP